MDLRYFAIRNWKNCKKLGPRLMEYAATWNLKISTLKIWNPRHRPALIYHQGLEIPQECSESFVSPSFLAKKKVKYTQMISIYVKMPSRGGICPCRHCRRQFKIFASGVHFSIFTHFLCFFSLKLLKLGEIDGVKFLAWKSGGVKFWTNSMSDFYPDALIICGNFSIAMVKFGF